MSILLQCVQKEPRRWAMKHFFVILILAVSLSGCSNKSPEYFQKKGQAIVQELIIDLQKIDDLESLREAIPTLQAHFDALSDVMIEARKWQIKTGKTCSVQPDPSINQHLVSELNRLLRNPLARHFIEKSQQTALEKLDAFEKKHQGVFCKRL